MTLVKYNNLSTSAWVWWLLVFTLGLSIYTYVKQDDSKGGVIAEPLMRQKPIALTVGTDKTKHYGGTDDLAKQTRTSNFNHQKNLFKTFTIQENSNIKNVHVKPEPIKVFTPVIPPVPFVYMGKLENTPKGTMVYLQGNDRVYAVAKGEKIDAFWRFDDEFIMSLQLTYLPLGVPQVLLKTQQVLPSVAVPVNEAN